MPSARRLAGSLPTEVMFTLMGFGLPVAASKPTAVSELAAGREHHATTRLTRPNGHSTNIRRGFGCAGRPAQNLHRPCWLPRGSHQHQCSCRSQAHPVCATISTSNIILPPAPTRPSSPAPPPALLRVEPPVEPPSFQLAASRDTPSEVVVAACKHQARSDHPDPYHTSSTPSLSRALSTSGRDGRPAL